jgi:phage tail protein X
VNEKKIIEPVRLDILAKEMLGSERDGCFEALLAANPGLADSGPFASEGATITIPAKPEQPARPTINVWD